MSEKAFTVKQVAERYSVPPQKVYNMLNEGVLTGIRLGPNGAWRIRPCDIEAFEARCLVKNLPSQTTDSASEEPSGASIGPTKSPVELDAFRRGRATAPQPRNGGTNG